MDEIRFAKVETTLASHDRRIGDTEAQIKNLADIVASNQEVIEIQKRLVEVGEGIIHVLGWVGKLAQWSTYVAGFCTLVWATIKGIAHLGAK